MSYKSSNDVNKNRKHCQRTIDECLDLLSCSIQCSKFVSLSTTMTHKVYQTFAGTFHGKSHLPFASDRKCVDNIGKMERIWYRSVHIDSNKTDKIDCHRHVRMAFYNINHNLAHTLRNHDCFSKWMLQSIPYHKMPTTPIVWSLNSVLLCCDSDYIS